MLVDVGALLDELGDDDGDVVVAAGLEREADQLGCGEVDRLGAEGHLDDVVADHVGEAVAAQEVAVAEHRLQPVVVGLVVVASEQRTQQQRAVRVDAGLVAADLALVDQALHERVVGADLLERAVTESVGAGVAEVRERDLGAVPQHRLEGRAHALDGGIASRSARRAGHWRAPTACWSAAIASTSRSRSSWRMMCIASAEARSPAAAPPMPSAMTSSRGLA